MSLKVEERKERGGAGGEGGGGGLGLAACSSGGGGGSGSGSSSPGQPMYGSEWIVRSPRRKGSEESAVGNEKRAVKRRGVGVRREV